MEGQTKVCRVSWGKLRLRRGGHSAKISQHVADPRFTPASTSAAMKLPPTTGRSPSSVLLGMLSLLLPSTPLALPQPESQPLGMWGSIWAPGR